MPRRASRRAVAARVGALVFVICVGVVGVMIVDQRDDNEVCTMALAIGEVDGLGVVYQDQGAPGPDDCDLPPNATDVHPNILRFDCKVIDQSGEVVAVDEPNHGDECWSN